MLIDQAKLDVANTTSHDRFSSLFGGSTAGQLDSILDVIPSSSLNNEIPFVQPNGSWLRWISEKHIASLKAYKQSIEFRSYHFSIELSRPELAYDQSGIVGRQIDKLMQKAKADHIKIIVDEMVSASGVGPNSYDAVAWLSTAHPVGDAGSTQSNKTTSALSFTTYDAAYQAMTSYVGDDGQPLGIVPDTLIVGPKNRKMAADIAGPLRPVSVQNSGVFNEQGSGVGGTAQVGGIVMPNVFQGDNLKVIVSNRLTGTQDDYAYLCCTSLPDKPFLLVEQRPPELVTQFDMNSESRFNLDKYKWSVETDCCPAPGFPLLTYGFIL